MTLWTKQLIILSAIGIIFTASGIILLYFSSYFHDNESIEKKLPLTQNSWAFKVWNMSDTPKNVDFYFFNWTNPEELEIPGKKPNFIEVGPYRFIERIEKLNVIFHPENSTMSYDQQKFWYFDVEKSNGNINDKILQLNIMALTATHTARYWSRFNKNNLSYVLYNIANISILKTVDQLLFSDYKSQLIAIKELLAYKKGSSSNRFAWFAINNKTPIFDGHVNMGTGVDNLNNLGVIKNWNYKNTTSYYESSCNRVDGTVGEFWRQNQNSKEIKAWMMDFCRHVTYEYAGRATHHGISGYQYEISEKTFGNVTKNNCPYDKTEYFENTTQTDNSIADKYSIIESNENFNDSDSINMKQCYCNGECSPIGLFNNTSCAYDVPRFISLPHFYKGDAMLNEQVTGLNPNERYHSSYIILEPNTGIPLDVNVKFQINILLQPSSTILFKNVPKIYFPIFWFNVKNEINQDLMWTLNQLLIPPNSVLYPSIALIIIGVLILGFEIVIHFARTISQKLTIAGKKSTICNSKNTKNFYMDKTMKTYDDHCNDRLI